MSESLIAGSQRRLAKALESAFNRRSITLLTIAVGLGFLMQKYKSEVPWLTALELYSHAFLSALTPRPQRVSRVAVVEVDDQTFWSDRLAGGQPTNRQFLGEVAEECAKANAGVIGVDFALKSPQRDKPGDSPARKAQNTYLMRAVRNITQGTDPAVSRRKIPVILTYGLISDDNGDWVREANIFADEALPHGVELGHMNLPRDKRQIPLVMYAHSWNDSKPHPVNSFAWQLATALERVQGIRPSLSEYPAIRKAVAHQQFIYGGFLRQEAFPHLSALSLVEHRLSGAELAPLSGRVVIIGGTWHRYSRNAGPPIESFESAVGRIPGLYLHANYVESLLDGRFQQPISEWLAAGIDLLAGAVILVSFHLPNRRRRRVAVLSVFFGLLLLAYGLPTVFGFYFDFILPLVIVLIHLYFERGTGLKTAKAESTP